MAGSGRLPLCPKPSGGWYSMGCVATFHVDAFGNIERVDMVSLDAEENKVQRTLRSGDAAYKALSAAGLIPARIARLAGDKAK